MGAAIYKKEMGGKRNDGNVVSTTCTVDFHAVRNNSLHILNFLAINFVNTTYKTRIL